MCPENYVIAFDIPYHIQVRDSFKGNRESRFYPVIENIPAELRFESNTVDSYSIAIAGTAVGDRHGNLGYSSVQVWFGEDFIDHIPEDIENEVAIDAVPVFRMGSLGGLEGHLIENAVMYVNKFLEVYRSRTSFYWITPLSPYTITQFAVVDHYKNQSDDVRYRFVTESPLKTGPLNDSVQNEIKRGVQLETPITLYNQLDLNAEDKISRGDYNSAIIDSAILFETWIKEAFQIIAVKKGYSESWAIDKVTKGDGSGDYLSPKNIASDQILRLGFDFSETDEFQRWDKKTREVRNNVVHEGYQSNENEAREAKSSAIKAIVRLCDEFEDELERSPLLVREEAPYLSKREEYYD